MKTLNEHLIESLLDDENDLINNDESIIEYSIKNFLDENYEFSHSYTINKLNNKSKRQVFVIGEVRLKENSKIEELTNNEFEFGTIKGSFLILYKNNIKTLQGMPKDIYNDLIIKYTKIKDLEGISKYIGEKCDIHENDDLLSLKGLSKTFVGSSLNISNNKSLKSLNGSPEKVKGDFLCGNTNINTLEGAPKEVGGNFICSFCKNLKSLKGLSKIIQGNLYYTDCPNLKDDNINSIINGNVIY